MRRLRDSLVRDPGLAMLLLAVVAAAVLYAPTLDHGLANFDDDWLFKDNFILQHPSLTTLRLIFFEVDVSPARWALGAEYLPIRDLSVMLDFILWGDRYELFHLTNLVLYLTAITLVFKMLDAFGVDRKTAGLAVLLWAIHPSHAESVAWLSERKGLLAIVFAAAAGWSYAKFRAGGHTRWLIAATIATVCAVWSKAPAAFTIAAFAGLEVVLPERRVSWRRSLTGLATMAFVGAAAFVPVVIIAGRAQVIGDSAIPSGKLATVIGVHGFYVRLGAMAFPNSPSYPIAYAGPDPIDLIIGALGLVAALVACAPRLGRHRVPRDLRAAAVLWLIPWLPVSNLVTLPRVAADRYALVLTLGLTLAVAVAVMRIGRPQLRLALCAVICLTAGVRTWDAQHNWSSDRLLWQRATESNPLDGGAWSLYANLVEQETGDPQAGLAIVDRGLEHGHWATLLHRRALLLGKLGDPGTLAAMREAAEAGDVPAMANLAGMLLDAGQTDEALTWASRASATQPMYAFGRRAHGIVLLHAHRFELAVQELTFASALEPKPSNRFFLALALLELGRTSEAITHLEACTSDPKLGARARIVLEDARRKLSPPR